MKKIIFTRSLLLGLLLCTMQTKAFSKTIFPDQYSFTDKFIELAENDGAVDKSEFNYLIKLSGSKQIIDRKFARKTIENLSIYKKRTDLSYSIMYGKNQEYNLRFTFSPFYDEDELVPGKNMLEKLSNISQADILKDTFNDGERCASSSLINAYLLMGGDFSALSSKFSQTGELSYKNIHYLQEKIYNYANTNKEPGLDSGYRFLYDQNGEVSKTEVVGEIISAADLLGLKLVALLGKNKYTLNQRKEAVEKFINENPGSVLQIGVKLDKNSGIVYPARSDEEQNHFVTVIKSANDFYIIDTGQIDNGRGKNLMLLNDNQINAFIYYTSGIIYGLSFK